MRASQTVHVRSTQFVKRCYLLQLLSARVSCCAFWGEHKRRVRHLQARVSLFAAGLLLVDAIVRLHLFDERREVDVEFRSFA